MLTSMGCIMTLKEVCHILVGGATEMNELLFFLAQRKTKTAQEKEKPEKNERLKF